MAFDLGAVVGKMVLDRKDWDASVNKGLDDMDSMEKKTARMGENFKQTGRQISSLGTRIAMLGTLAMTPFALSIRTAAQENYSFQMRLNTMGDEIKRIQANFANAFLPVLDKFNNTLKGLNLSLDNFNPSLKETIFRFTGLSVVGLVVAGVLLKVAGALVQISPLVSVVGAAFAGWKIGEKISEMSGLNEALSGEDGLFTKMWMWLEEKKLLEKWESFIGIFRKKSIAGNIPTMDLGQIVVGGGGANKQLSDEGVKTFTWVDTFNRKMTEFSAGFQKSLKDAIVELSNFGKLGEDIAKRMATGMSDSISSLFFNVFSGQLSELKQVFADWGNSLLKMLSDVFAKIFMYYAIINPLTASFPGLKPAFGLAEGTNYVPYTGVYKLHAGEEVKPAKYSKENSETKPIMIYNMITPEAIAAAMSGEEGTGVIINAVTLSSLNNGPIRKEVKLR